MEYAPARRVNRRGQIAFQQNALAIVTRVNRRHSRHQRPRIRVLRMVEHLVRVALFHQVTQIHHAHAVGNVPNDAHVVRHKQVRQPALALQLLQQVDNLRLNRHIQRRHRLVAHDNLRIKNQRARQADALPLTTGELVRITVEMLRPQADLRHDVQRPRHPLVLVADMVNRQHFHQHVANALPRVQRRVRVLEHNLHIPAERQHFLLAQVGDVLIE